MSPNKFLKIQLAWCLGLSILLGHLLVPPAITAQRLPGNGIYVGQTKIYDERSLAVMVESLQAKLANRDFFDQASIAAAIGKFQGARLDTSSLGVNVTTTPIPGVSTEANTGTTTITSEKVTQAAVAAGVAPGQPATENSTQVTTPNTLKETVTQGAITATPATLPSQTSTFTAPSAFGIAPQTLLAQQIEVTHALDNVRLLMEGSITDRVITSDVAIASAITPATFSGARSRAVVGFEIDLDSPQRYENAVAEVEITITTAAGAAADPPSVVAVLPRENNYNVATVTKNAQQFGFGVAVQPINFGLSAQKQKETLYLVEDLDTVSFQRAQPWNAPAPAGSVTFGWQFRPVLGQKVVKPGPRQVFASLALPANDFVNFVGHVEARTFWRKYDPKKKTVGDYIKGSDKFQMLNDLKVPGTLLMTNEPLQPESVQLDWLDVGQGNILVTSRGQHYLPGMGILLGNQIIDTADNGFVRQSDKSFRWLVPGARVALVEDALLAGRFGPPVKLRNENARTDTGTAHLNITHVQTASLDAQNSKVTVSLAAGVASDFNPIIILNNKAYGFSDAPLVKVSSIAFAGPSRHVVVEFVIPTQALRDATKLTARLLFFGRDYTAELLAANFNPPGGSSYMANKVMVISAGSTPRFGITGSGFNPANVIVDVDGIKLAANGIAGANGAKLTFIDQTLLNLTMPAPLAKSVKQITLIQSGAPSLLPLAAPPSPIAKPKITSIDSINVGDQAYVTVNGENLGSIDKASFSGTQLKIKDVSDDGKTMQLLIIKEISEKPGRRSIDFLSKDGTTEVSRDLSVRP